MLHEDESSDSEKTKQNENKCAIEISKPNTKCKLNPLVKEFVPRGMVSPRKSPRSIKCSTSHGSKDGAPKTPQKTNQKQLNLHSSRKSVESAKSPADSIETTLNSPKDCVHEQANGLSVETNMTDKMEAEPTNIMKRTNELRDKISQSLKSDSPIHKKERNVAIANLLKLHSSKPSPYSSNTNINIVTDGKGLKLFTPDYFKNTKLPTASNDDKIETEPERNVTVNEKNEDDTVKVEPMESTIQESIEKVNNWLEPKATSPSTTSSPVCTGPVICMGPVSFKRKEVNCKSPADCDTKIAKNIRPFAQFKPSKYADDLAKKYTERSQMAEQREMSIWDNLKRELKKKDEQIRKKQAANTLV
ncbi:uncharacterized protein LOC128673477 isoform X2 [Plodia interpunctella]|nr:uncharacterized protein LOC128673477 isoform X2 [Plodia interpunctella]